MKCKDCDLNYYPCEGEKIIKRLKAEVKKLREAMDRAHDAAIDQSYIYTDFGRELLCEAILREALK